MSSRGGCSKEVTDGGLPGLAVRGRANVRPIAGFRFPRNPGYKRGMAKFLSHGLVPIAIGAVAVVLLLGLINMMRGGSPNTSQKLMRLRVLLQFVAIVIIMFTIWVISLSR
jgi:hypothetical protein